MKAESFMAQQYKASFFFLKKKSTLTPDFNHQKQFVVEGWPEEVGKLSLQQMYE